MYALICGFGDSDERRLEKCLQIFNNLTDINEEEIIVKYKNKYKKGITPKFYGLMNVSDQTHETIEKEFPFCGWGYYEYFRIQEISENGDVLYFED